ncbi:MAG: TonB-dependent receptor [Treponema sp.]|nr:TonB-dependent receptor [Treponema sp.]
MWFILSIALPLFAQEGPAPDGGDYPFAEEDDWNDPFLDDPLVMEDEGITITGTKESSQQMKTITREDIEKANAPDLAALLEETAGLSTARYGPHGSMGDINLRGMDAERVAFLIDGIPANSPASGEFDYNAIDINSIERIEVIYGGSDSRYNVSGAIGGVINIVTVKRLKPGWRMAGSLSNMSAMPGSYYKPYAGNQPPRYEDLADTQNITFSAGLGLENTSVSLNWFGSRAANHFLYDDNFGRRRRKENSEVWDTGFSAAVVQEFDDLSKFIVNGSLYYGDKNITESGYSELYSNYRDVSTRENILWEMPRAFHDALAMEASLSHAAQNQKSAGTATDIHAVMAINRWTWYPLPALTLRFGGDYRYALAETGAYHDRHDGGLSLGAEWLPHRSLTLIPSIKLALQSRGGAVPVPKFGVLWKPAEALVIKNNYFRSYKIPDMVDLYWQGGDARGDPDLKPEDGWGGDLGAAWNHRFGGNAGGPRLALEGNGFAQWYDQSIHWYNGRPRNVGGAFYFGMDTAARLTLPLAGGPFESLGVSLTYQYMMSWLLAYGYTWESDKRIPYMPVHRPGLRVELAWKGGSLALSGVYEAERVAEDYTTVLDPWFSLTVNANQKIGERFAAFAVIRNALDQRYQSFKGYPMPGITVTVGIKANFEP